MPVGTMRDAQEPLNGPFAAIYALCCVCKPYAFGYLLGTPTRLVFRALRSARACFFMFSHTALSLAAANIAVLRFLAFSITRLSARSRPDTPLAPLPPGGRKSNVPD